MDDTYIGRRVRLVCTDDDFTDLVPGDEGTIDFIDSTGTVFVAWDRGSHLGMVAGAGDRWELIAE